MAVDNLVGNGGNITKAMLKAGYKKATANTPQKLTQSKGFKEEVKPILEQLESERQRAVKKLKGKISKAKYRDLVDAVDKLTKNIQLLSGGATERVEGIEISFKK